MALVAMGCRSLAAVLDLTELRLRYSASIPRGQLQRLLRALAVERSRRDLSWEVEAREVREGRQALHHARAAQRDSAAVAPAPAGAPAQGPLAVGRCLGTEVVGSSLPDA